jgi:transcriptional regulator with XRE-family HTH domain
MAAAAPWVLWGVSAASARFSRERAMRADILPKGRAVPIRGDMVRTLRFVKGWNESNPLKMKEYARKLKLSADRLAEIERGGARVFKRNLYWIAEVFGVAWDDLVDWKALGAELPPDPAKEAQPPVGRHRISIHGAGGSDTANHLNINKLYELANQLGGEQGKIAAITLDDSGVVVTLEISDEAVLRFANNFYSNNNGNQIVSATIHLDVRVAGQVYGGGGLHGLSLRRLIGHWKYLAAHARSFYTQRLLSGLGRILGRRLAPEPPELDDFYKQYYVRFFGRLVRTLRKSGKPDSTSRFSDYIESVDISSNFYQYNYVDSRYR